MNKEIKISETKKIVVMNGWGLYVQEIKTNWGKDNQVLASKPIPTERVLNNWIKKLTK